jgi:mannosyltransferase OCH1-like enzyme
MSIPKLVHVIWLQGYDQLNNSLKENYNKLKDLNKDFEFMFWDNNSIRTLIQSIDVDLLNVYDNIKSLKGNVSNFTSQSDIGRFVILYVYGGIYTDIDIQCNIPFNKILSSYPDCTMIIADNTYKILQIIPFIYKPKYYSGFMATTKEQSIWKPIFNEIKTLDSRNSIGEVVDKYIQKNKVPVCVFKSKDISSHTSCETGSCFFPSESSWFMGRHLLIGLSCNFEIILTFILILILILVLKKNKSKR